MRIVERTEAVEVVQGGTGVSPFVLTCEHADVRMPEPWEWPESDRWAVGTHWSWDPGAADLTRELADALGCMGVLSRFSRLLCDPNRSETDPGLFRDIAEGLTLKIAPTTAEDREERLAKYHRPYHEMVDRIVGGHPGQIVLSMHTFTPLYEGQPRSVEIGVLFDHEDALGVRLAAEIAARGLPTWLNEPYSGKAGLIYSASRHAAAHGRAALELEVRQDLATDPVWRANAVPKLAQALLALLTDVSAGANPEFSTPPASPELLWPSPTSPLDCPPSPLT